MHLLLSGTVGALAAMMAHLWHLVWVARFARATALISATAGTSRHQHTHRECTAYALWAGSLSPVQLHVANLVPAHPDIMVAAISAGEQSPDDDGCITVTRILTPPEGDALYDYEGHDLRLLFHLNRTEAAYLIAGVDATPGAEGRAYQAHLHAGGEGDRLAAGEHPA